MAGRRRSSRENTPSAGMGDRCRSRVFPGTAARSRPTDGNSQIRDHSAGRLCRFPAARPMSCPNMIVCMRRGVRYLPMKSLILFMLPGMTRGLRPRLCRALVTTLPTWTVRCRSAVAGPVSGPRHRERHSCLGRRQHHERETPWRAAGFSRPRDRRGRPRRRAGFRPGGRPAPVAGRAAGPATSGVVRRDRRGRAGSGPRAARPARDRPAQW